MTSQDPAPAAPSPAPTDPTGPQAGPGPSDLTGPKTSPGLPGPSGTGGGGKRSKKRRRLRLLLFGFLFLAVLLGAGGAWFLNLDLPDVRSLEDYRPATPTRLLSRDGSVIHQFGVERRVVIRYEDIPPVLRNAIVAVEDQHFFEHVGVDPMGIARAAVKDVIHMRKAEGGSTLTQQLTRTPGLFLRTDKTWRRKIREAVLAMQIEKTYTKEEIFTLYCNQVYMGHGYYGVEAASEFYFGKKAQDLELPQAAMLAGIIQTPERLSPFRNAQAALRRRNHVLKRMQDVGYIDKAAYESARKAPSGAAQTQSAEKIGSYFTEEVRRDLDASLGEEALYREGMTIETGLDMDLQRAAEAALDRGVREIAKRRPFKLPAENILKEKKGELATYKDSEWTARVAAGQVVRGLVMDVNDRRAVVRVGADTFEVGREGVAWTGRETPSRIFRPGDIAPFLVIGVPGGALRMELSAEPICNGAVLAMDPATGEIRALVGGLDFEKSQFDRAIQAERQPGSAFKPIIYAAAIEEGWKATDLLLDEPTVFVDPQTQAAYQPENYYRDYNGLVTVRYALEHSLNIATIRMLNLVGYQRAVDQAKRMGITSSLRPYPALGLGASEVKLIDLVSSYAIFANLGTRVEPRLHGRVLDHEGRAVSDQPPRGNDVLRPEVAYLMTSLMKGVIARGTAVDAATLGDQIAGKTGTTDDNTDAWFVGYSPSLALGVWVGKDDKKQLGTGETGARAALPIWIDIMRAWLAAHPGETLKRPPGIESVPVDYRTGLKAGVDTGCDQVILEDFTRDDPGPALCSRQAHQRARLPYYLQRYPWVEEGVLALTDQDLARVLREGSFEVSDDRGDRLLIRTPGGTMTVAYRILGTDDPALATMAGGAALSGPRGGVDMRSRQGDGLLGLVFPADLAPLDADPASHPTLGLDGRTAAIIPIRYP